MITLKSQYRTRPVLEMLKVIQSNDHADQTVPKSHLKRKRSRSQDQDTNAELLRVMMDMRVSPELPWV
jgi:hypothetical protein